MGKRACNSSKSVGDKAWDMQKRYIMLSEDRKRHLVEDAIDKIKAREKKFFGKHTRNRSSTWIKEKEEREKFCRRYPLQCWGPKFKRGKRVTQRSLEDRMAYAIARGKL